MLDTLRSQIDSVDSGLIRLLSTRFNIVDRVGQYKREHTMEAYQGDRWATLLQSCIEQGRDHDISETCIREVWEAIHRESLRREERILGGE